MLLVLPDSQRTRFFDGYAPVFLPKSLSFYKNQYTYRYDFSIMGESGYGSGFIPRIQRGGINMKAEYINPFLESARMVIEQMVQIRPSTGQLAIRDIKFQDNHVWIQIGLTGQMTGDIVFGLSESVAMRIISAMMGGFVITEIDDLGKSAISELGNMISGNASTMLYNQGVHVDITPPKIVDAKVTNFGTKRALAVPLIMDGIGEMEIQVLIA